MGALNSPRTTFLMVSDPNLAFVPVSTVYMLPRVSSAVEVMAASVRRWKAMGFKEEWPKVF